MAETPCKLDDEYFQLRVAVRLDLPALHASYATLRTRKDWLGEQMRLSRQRIIELSRGRPATAAAHRAEEKARKEMVREFGRRKRQETWLLSRIYELELSPRRTQAQKDAARESFYASFFATARAHLDQPTFKALCTMVDAVRYDGQVAESPALGTPNRDG